ncbi:MAG: universal stress protein [Thermovirgaceae bacterium]
MKRVIVAIDGSEASKRVIEYALQYAEKEKDAELVFFHAIESVESKHIQYTGYALHVPPSEDDVREQFTQIVEDVRKKLNSPVTSYSVEVKAGISYEEIVDFATKHDASVIMIGHRGISGVRRFLLGSVAAKVVAHAPCSVYVHRPKEKA